jgi:tripartite-type tricarboxylate transporter receptor subunit TctC
MRTSVRALARSAVAIVASLAAAAVFAQGYPAKPVRIVVPFPPGGTNDILGRLMAERLQKSLGQSFVVENRSGAGGMIGADAVAKSAGGGYTLLLSSSAPLAVGLSLFKGGPPYDVVRDFVPVAMVADVTVAFVAYPGFPASSVKEVVAVARAKPGTVRVALPALGSVHHLLAEIFRTKNALQVNMIPYKGTGPAVIDLIAGHVDIDFENLPAVVQHIKAGKLRALAVASAERTPVLPDVPTFKELGMPELVAAPWFALVAPAGTPNDVVALLNQQVQAILKAPDTREVLEKQGANAVLSTPEETGKFIRAEIDRWATVVRDTGAKVE